MNQDHDDFVFDKPKGKKKKMTVKESHEILIAQESDKMIEQEKIIKRVTGT